MSGKKEPWSGNRSDLIDFGLKGPEEAVSKAAEWLENQLHSMSIEYKLRETG